MSKQPEPGDVDRLRAEWEERARSSLGRFFIASQADWEDPTAWNAQAAQDLSILLFGLESSWLKEARVLELGCGVGRLARLLSPHVGSYTGIDISSTYVEQARRDLAHHAHCTFLVAPGDALPPEIAPESMDLIFAWAVFIHLPLPLIETLLRVALPCLAPGGMLRFQVLTDPSLPGGGPPPDAPGDLPFAADAALAPADDRAGLDAVAPILEEAGLRHLVEDRSYKGHVFAPAELEHLLGTLAAGAATSRMARIDPQMLYGEIRRPGS